MHASISISCMLRWPCDGAHPRTHILTNPPRGGRIQSDKREPAQRAIWAYLQAPGSSMVGPNKGKNLLPLSTITIVVAQKKYHHSLICLNSKTRDLTPMSLCMTILEATSLVKNAKEETTSSCEKYSFFETVKNIV